MHHNYIFRHCPVCGDIFEKKKVKANEPPRLVCKNRDCRFVFYLDPKVVACAIVEMDGMIVLLKRAKSPERGKWVMPGGYVDRGEKVEDAAIRETKEECGIDIELKGLFGVYSYPGYLEVIVVYLADYRAGRLIARDETTDSKLVRIEDIPWDELAFESTRDTLRDYCELKKKTQRS
ncbi:MAG: NUDIX domain-containing protein [Deltaproteobacteria bacterium]|nr:NUDIX domain-containing protein [Deltaproteobacteria bacterium]